MSKLSHLFCLGFLLCFTLHRCCKLLNNSRKIFLGLLFGDDFSSKQNFSQVILRELLGDSILRWRLQIKKINVKGVEVGEDHSSGDHVLAHLL